MPSLLLRLRHVRTRLSTTADRPNPLGLATIRAEVLAAALLVLGGWSLLHAGASRWTVGALP